MADSASLASTLAGLDQGFRQTYLDHDALTAQVHAWARAFPELVRVESLGTSAEGRDLWLLTIGPEPDRVRPAVWVDGNMHASELCGSSVALAIAEDALRLHLGANQDVQHLQDLQDRLHLPAAALPRLRELLFYVMPRMSPDGAEHVLTSGRYLRSNARDERRHHNQPRWRACDIDGDGLMLKMRVPDPGGEFVESSEVPGLMLLRRIEDQGPFYKIYPEGVIDGFDGHTIPTPSFLSDNPTDLNRNFPWSWAPEPAQAGAGPYPMSEPESRAVVAFTARHPNIVAWLNCHTFGGVFIRPLGNRPDSEMNPADLALFRQIGAWCEELTGYPMVSGFEDFTYEPDKPLHGDLTSYAFHQRGCVAYVVELWDLFRQIGVERSRHERFVDHYSHLTRSDLIELGRWDAAHNQSRVIRPWTPCEHPQLGRVEVGGLDPRIGIWNPPYDRIAGVCRDQSAAFLRVAALAPALRADRIEQTALGGGLTRVTVTVENHGYLPTYVLSSARDLDFCEPVHAELDPGACTLEDAGTGRRVIGHLDGWGRGLHDGTGALFYLTSRGNTHAGTVSWVVRGAGTVTVRAGSCRTGWIEQRIDIRGE